MIYNNIKERDIIYYSDCGTYGDSNFCPNCGKDLRNVIIRKAPIVASVPKSNEYSAYMQYYPDKLEAIRSLRIDTGMSLADAKRMGDFLFGDTDGYSESSITYSKKITNVDKEAMKQTAKKAAKTAGIATSAGLLAGLKVIFGIAKKQLM